MTAKRFYWLKLRKDFFNRLAIKGLLKREEGYRLVIAYLKILLLSIETDGIIRYEGVGTDLMDEICMVLDEPTDVVEEVLKFIIGARLAEVIPEENGIILFDTAENIGSESDSAERVRQMRNRKKNESLHCNAVVTECNDDVTQRREEKETEEEEETEEEYDFPNFSPDDFTGII